MRVLVATTAGAGHLGPILPFAAACRDAGHEVAVAAPASFAPAVARTGLPHLPFPDAPEDEWRAVMARLPGLGPDEANAVVIGEVFAGIDARAALPGVEEIVARWEPDLILRESSEFASFLVAQARGIPHVQVSIGLRLVEEFGRQFVEEPLTALGAEPGLHGLVSAPRLTLVPPSLEDPSAPGPSATLRFRDHAGDRAGTELPDWWKGSSDPLVYVSFGTVAAGMGLFPGFYREIVAALEGLPVRVLLTVGDAGDPAGLAPLPPNVHVERWWPQAGLMAHTSAMVCHGGFGTTLLGLASGVPMVVLPLFADQPYNARRVATLGAGIALEGGPAAAGAVGDAIGELLGDQAYRAAAGRFASEIAGLPPSSDAVGHLEALVAR